MATNGEANGTLFEVYPERTTLNYRTLRIRSSLL